MPELPEVETIRRTLAPLLEHRTITRVEVLLPRLLKNTAAPDFCQRLAGRRIVALARRGKYLLLNFDQSLVLVVHLRMTGRLYHVTEETEPDRFTRIIFYLDNGHKLFYADVRTLGTIFLVNQDELNGLPGLASLGPEPLTSAFTPAYLQQLLAGRRGKIKAVLLNQHYIAGLGNIYIDESLHEAGLDPERPAATLTAAEIQRLYNAINAVIAAGIADGGTTFRDYRDGTGHSGSHQRHLGVYGREGEICAECGGMIARKVVAGRGSYYCPHCQH